jgi:hypothetical protein
MDPGLIGIFILCSASLLLLLGVAWVINKLVKRPLFNGAAVFFWLLASAIIGLIAYQLSLPHVTWKMGYYAGQSVAAVSPVLLVAFILMLRFRRRKRMAVESLKKPELPPTAPQ